MTAGNAILFWWVPWAWLAAVAIFCIVVLILAQRKQRTPHPTRQRNE